MKRWIPSLAAFALALSSAAHALGEKSFVVNDGANGAVALAHGGRASPVYIDANDDAGVIRAATDLQADVERVSAVKPELAKGGAPSGADVVIVGTLGKSAMIDALVKSKAIDVSDVRDRWEGFLIQAVAKPMPGVERALVIAGRGPPRHDLRHLRRLRADRRVALVLVGRRAGGPSRRGVRRREDARGRCAGREVSRHLHQRRGAGAWAAGRARSSAGSTTRCTGTCSS